MATYKLTVRGDVIRTADGVAIPPDPLNRDYAEYLSWLSNGGTADPSDPPPTVYSGSSEMTGRIRTTDATAVEIFRATLATNTGYRALATVLGVDAGNGAVRQIYASIVAKRLGAGALLVGTPVVIANHQDASASTWAIAASVAGNDVLITVTGAAGRNVDWLLDGNVLRFGPGGLP